MSSGARDEKSRPGTISRRRFVRTALMAAVPMLAPGVAMAAVRLPGTKPRSLSFYNLHTGETLKSTYFDNGNYVPGALHEINYLLRDFRTGEIKAIDPRLLDLLAAINGKLETSRPFDVISGYRSPQTNAMLHAHSEGVAVHSLHIQGKAIDIRVPGRALVALRHVAMSLRGGGVGYYPHSDFVHVDTGRVRYW